MVIFHSYVKSPEGNQGGFSDSIKKLQLVRPPKRDVNVGEQVSPRNTSSLVVSTINQFVTLELCSAT